MPAEKTLELRPSRAPSELVVDVPGSKSITNRALLIAALARGRTVLRRALVADDTSAMCDVLQTLGVNLKADDGGRTLVVSGRAGTFRPTLKPLDGRSAGTVARFLPPALTLGSGEYVLDGSEQMRARPLSDLTTTLQAIGVAVEHLGADGHLPVRIAGTNGLVAEVAEISGAVSSQYASGLMLAAPCFNNGLDLTISGDVVSRPYLQITIGVMRSFGATVQADESMRRVQIAPGGYLATEYAIEPDASAASYFLAAAAITGKRVVIAGLGANSLQGDVQFARILERMGCAVQMHRDRIELTGPTHLRGIDVDLADISDTVPTLAAVAPFADTPTRIRGVGFIRGKESNRIAAVVHELRRAGIDADEHPDGLAVQPGQPIPCRIETYDDHRIAMAFALLGLRTSVLRIADPDCVRKTYPNFFADLAIATGLELLTLD